MTSQAQKISDRKFTQELEQYGYRLLGTIGKGSYAKVKECEHISRNGDRKRCAVKIIDKSKAPNDFLSKFLPREINIHFDLRHPNIIRFYSIKEYSNKIYLILELADAGDLLDFIKKRGPLPNNTAKRMFFQLAQAIKYIHSLQITHRDLKCENILLDKNYNVKLADFGFSRRCVDSETGRRILSNTYCGSAAYAAPEILQGSPYNPKLYDIWSLGCILYIMVCGCMPFDDSNIRKMIRVQMEKNLKFPSRVDALVVDLINHMLEPDVTRRANIDKVLRHPWLREQI